MPGGHCLIYILANPVVRCSDPGTPEHGRRQVSDSSLRLNTRIDFVCDTGYILQGTSGITCVGTGQWDYPLPSCVEESTRSDCV